LGIGVLTEQKQEGGAVGARAFMVEGEVEGKDMGYAFMLK
jgi:hypothetical protein